MTDAITAKLVRRFGPDAAAWAAGLPALVAGMDQFTEPATAARLRRSDFERALEELATLSASPSPTVLLHSDLHLGNVLDGGSRGLVVIDPMACVGHPCVDAIDYVLAGSAGGTASSTGYRRCPLRRASMPTGCMRGAGWWRRPAELLAGESGDQVDHRGDDDRAEQV